MLEYHLFNLVKPYRSLRLTYINLDNPAFSTDDRGVGYSCGDGETVEDEREQEGDIEAYGRGQTSLGNSGEGVTVIDRFRTNSSNLG